ncbi:hypothetical protein [Arthrobacter caoxuetaonis]|uniref:Uncharacterized protein n=1 Tax=Arthrobacter caoxuetaonis TaxID=2886935 RepID=A0A9X1SDZ1_9MICC|nr:hypothetical protein [Arthrobacter caoxuetaonis]MCC3299262.1 hypothetical protein [Arthrobacter caoxuetaonis]USQ59244.1 hypothetical protein NF551_16810 [Arthrobacter caoxuetaonis]
MIERLRTMRQKGAKDRGVIMMSTLILLVLISGTTYAMVSTTGRSIMSSTLNKDFGQAGQLADRAVQEAIYQLNEKPTATKPTASSRAYSTKDEDGDGVKDWNWYLEPIAATGPRSTVIHAEGTYRGTTRKVEVKAGALLVGGFTSRAADQLTYEVSPETAFRHVALGRFITMQNGIGISADTKFVDGRVGVLKDKPVMTLASGTSAKNGATYLLYGTEASRSVLSPSSRIPAGLKLDSKFIDDNINRCGGATLVPWIASEHGGVLVANGNTGCYSTMTFDVPTTILGSGAFNAFVNGATTIKANITGAATAGLNIYTKGGVDFRTEDSAGTSLTVSNTFIYAPNGTCRTVVNSDAAQFRSTSKSLTFTGSLACDTVKAAGRFTAREPISPLGGRSAAIKPGDTYNSEVWYLIDYKQPSGARR